MAIKKVIFKHNVEERDTSVPIGKGTPHKPNSIGWLPITPFEELGSGSGNAEIQFKDEGSNLGAIGTVAAVDFVGAGVTATRASNTVTVTIPSATGTTNLSYTAAPTTGTVVSDTGTDATVPLATGTNAGLLPPVPATTALTASGVDTAADYMLIWDNSASAYKKILPTFVNAVADTIGTHNGATFRYAILTGTPTVTYDTSTATAPILTVAGGTIKLKELWVPYTSGGSTDPIFLINGTVSATRFYSTPIVTKIIENSTTPTLAGTYNQQDVDNTPQVRFGDYTATSVSVQLASVTGSWNFGFLFSMNQ